MYTEKVWQERVNNQFSIDGFVSAPIVSMTKLKIPTNDRSMETLFMSLFYDNNLMNGFLSRTLGLSFCSPHCSCNLWKVEDTQHVLLECLHVKPWKRRIMSNYLEGVSQNIPDFHIILTNCSRDSTFVKLAMDIIDDCHGYLRKEIVLPSRCRWVCGCQGMSLWESVLWEWLRGGCMLNSFMCYFKTIKRFRNWILKFGDISVIWE